MALRWGCCLVVVVAARLGFLATGTAHAQDAVLQPIPAADCQIFAVQAQGAAGFAMTAGAKDVGLILDAAHEPQRFRQASELGVSLATVEARLRLPDVQVGWMRLQAARYRHTFTVSPGARLPVLAL